MQLTETREQLLEGARRLASKGLLNTPVTVFPCGLLGKWRWSWRPELTTGSK